MSRGQVEQLFTICDVSGKGYLTETDLVRVCPQLSQTVGGESSVFMAVTSLGCCLHFRTVGRRRVWDNR